MIVSIILSRGDPVVLLFGKAICELMCANRTLTPRTRDITRVYHTTYVATDSLQ